MTAFLIENLAPIMFVALIVILLLGYPVGFALAFTGLVFGIVGIELGVLKPNLFGALPDRIFGQLSNEILLAVPFFTLMGLVLERSGMAEDLLDTIGQLFGPVRGGIAFAVIFVGAILAATTGVVAASVISMGLISLPIMLRYGYDRRLAAGTIAASGTLAQIIPPSLVLIVLGDQLGRPIGDMYKGALVPGLMLVGAYVAYVALIALTRPTYAPAIPEAARTLRGWRLVWRVCTALVPPLVLIFLVLGTIFIGLATPTEGGAMGAVGALALALVNRRLSFDLLKQALYATVKLSSFVMFILLGARVFSLTFYGVNGHVWVEHLLTSIPGGEVGFLIVVNLLVFFLAFFLDYFELAFIIIPLLAPVADALGIDLVWFGVMLAINMQTSFMHPPFGFSLFFLRSVAPTRAYRDKITGETIQPVTSGQIYRGAIPYLIIQLLMVAVIIAFPGLVMHYKGVGSTVNPDTIHLNVPAPDSGASSPEGVPDFGGEAVPAPSFGGEAPAGTPAAPKPEEGSDIPAPTFGGEAPAKPAETPAAPRSDQQGGTDVPPPSFGAGQSSSPPAAPPPAQDDGDIPPPTFGGTP